MWQQCGEECGGVANTGIRMFQNILAWGLVTKRQRKKLSKLVAAAKLKPVLRGGVLCLASDEPKADNKHERIHVPVHLRTPLIQRMHCGTYAGHFGFKKTLAKLQQRYIWGAIKRDVAKAFANVYTVLAVC